MVSVAAVKVTQSVVHSLRFVPKHERLTITIATTAETERNTLLSTVSAALSAFILIKFQQYLKSIHKLRAAEIFKHKLIFNVFLLLYVLLPF